MAALAENDRLTGPFVAVAGQVDFPADFPLIEGPDDPPGSCAVIVRLRAGSRVELTHAQFTVSAASDNGFTARLNVPAQAGDTYWIMGRQRQARARAHVPNGAIRTPTLESDAREAAAKAQEVARDLALTMRVPVGEVPPSPQQIVEAVEMASVKLNKATLKALTDSFQGVGDGVMDDTNAVLAAQAAGGAFVPAGTFKTDLNANTGTLAGPLTGEGQVVDFQGNRRGHNFMSISSRLPSHGNYEYIGSAFNGDWTRSFKPKEVRILGLTTLGTPSTGYLYNHEYSADFVAAHVQSGWNESPSSNEGRTGYLLRSSRLLNYGPADAIANHVSGFVVDTSVAWSAAKTYQKGERARYGGQIYQSLQSGNINHAVADGSWWAVITDVLAMPAVVALGADVTAGSDCVYLNSGEFYLDCASYSANAVGWVVNIVNRTDDRLAKAILHCYRGQSQGTHALDGVIAGAGLFRAFMDVTGTTLTSDKAAIALSSGDRIYGDATSSDGRKVTDFGEAWWEYNSSLRAWNLVVDNTSVLQVYKDQVFATKPLRIIPGSSVNPNVNGELTFEATSNTSVTVKLKGSDGVVRSGTITLS